MRRAIITTRLATIHCPYCSYASPVEYAPGEILDLLGDKISIKIRCQDCGNKYILHEQSIVMVMR